MQYRVDDCARFLWVKILFQLRRALDVGEQSRDGLTFAVGREQSIRLFWRDANVRRG